MPNPSKTPEDYAALASLLGLELIGDAPRSVQTAVDWKCLNCGRVHRRSYNKLKYAERGCRCQSDVGLTPADYHQAAARLGIKWVARKTPLTTLHETSWESYNGILFSATYHELGYSLINIPSRFYPYLPQRIMDQIEEVKAERLEAIRHRLEQL